MKAKKVQSFVIVTVILLAVAAATIWVGRRYGGNIGMVLLAAEVLGLYAISFFRKVRA